MQDLYYDEIDELLLEGTVINDVSQEVDKLKKIIATLTIVCGILIGICIAKHVEGNKKYLRGRDQGADDTIQYVNGQIKDQSKFGYVSRNEKGQRQEGLFLFRKDADGNYKLNEERSRTTTDSKKKFKDLYKKDRTGVISDKKFYKGHSVDLDLDEIDESYNDYNDFNYTDNSDTFNEILYMIEGTDNRKENLSLLKRIKSALFDRRKQLNTIKKNAKSKDADVQKQVVSDLLKIKSDIKKDKADLARMAKQIASNNEKIKQLLAGANL